MSEKRKTVFMCKVAWDCEVGETDVMTWPSVESLKHDHGELGCGIVKCEMTLNEVLEPEKPWAEQVDAFAHTAPTLSMRYSRLMSAYAELCKGIFGKDQADINSPECVLACMTEGEGSNPETYREFSKGALERLRKTKLRAMRLAAGKHPDDETKVP